MFWLATVVLSLSFLSLQVSTSFLFWRICVLKILFSLIFKNFIDFFVSINSSNNFVFTVWLVWKCNFRWLYFLWRFSWPTSIYSMTHLVCQSFYHMTTQQLFYTPHYVRLSVCYALFSCIAWLILLLSSSSFLPTYVVVNIFWTPF